MKCNNIKVCFSVFSILLEMHTLFACAQDSLVCLVKHSFAPSILKKLCLKNECPSSDRQQGSRSVGVSPCKCLEKSYLKILGKTCKIKQLNGERWTYGQVWQIHGTGRYWYICRAALKQWRLLCPQKYRNTAMCLVSGEVWWSGPSLNLCAAVCSQNPSLHN